MILGLWKTGIQPNMKHIVWEESLNLSWTSCGRRESLKVKICTRTPQRVLSSNTGHWHIPLPWEVSVTMHCQPFVYKQKHLHSNTHPNTPKRRTHAYEYVTPPPPPTSPSPSQLILITSWTLPVICPLDSVTQWPRNHLIPSKPPPCFCFQVQHVSQAQGAGGEEGFRFRPVEDRQKLKNTVNVS